jgi:hypothetical protein
VRRRTLALLVVGCGLVFILQLRPIDDVDLFWQIRLGQLTLERGQLVTADPFTYTHQGEPQPAIYWLAQLGCAGLHELGSWPLLRLINALLLAAAFILPALSSQTQAGDKAEALSSIIAAVVLCFLAGLSNSSVRPQSIALLGFAILLAVTRSHWSIGRKLLVLVPTLLLWQNCHPSTSLGVLVVGALAATNLVRWLRDRNQSFLWQNWVILLVVALSQFATPMSTDVLRVSRLNLEIARDWLAVTEWLPPWDPSVRGAMLPFWVALGVCSLLALRLWRSIRLEDACLFLLLTALTFTAARFALFWAVAMIPILVRWLEAVRPPTLFHWPDGPVSWPVALPLLLLSLAGAAVAPRVLPRPVIDPEIPLDGIRALRSKLTAGRIYNYREWGGPLILEGASDWRIAIDGRLYLFDDRTEWEEYEKAALGLVPVEELVRRHRPDAFFLRPTYHAELVSLLRAAPDWPELFADANCVVFVRNRR